jgi:hypothetical protein
MILGVTGHRPSSLPGADRFERRILEERLLVFATSFLEQCPFGRPDEVITGMAEGWDMAVADACIALDIQFCAAVPFAGQEQRWGPRSQERYRALLQRAARVEVLATSYLKRDEWIVDHCNALVALCGKKTGGSAYTIAYAEQWRVPVINIWPRWVQLHQ